MSTPSPTSSTSGEYYPDVPPIFCELLELCKYDDGYQEWKELSRWIKFEEDVEEEGNRWGKPHVSTPSLQGWLQLRHHLRNGLILVDLEARDLFQICEKVSDRLVSDGRVTSEVGKMLRDLWLKKHRHQFEGPRKIEGNFTQVIKDLLVQKLENKAQGNAQRVGGSSRANSKPGSRRGSFSRDLPQVQTLQQPTADEEGKPQQPLLDDGKVNFALQKKMATNTEAAIILEGVVDFLDKPVSVFIKLAKPLVLGDLPEVDIPTRFIYLMAGPPTSSAQSETLGKTGSYADLGISLATAMTNRKFSQTLYSAETPGEIVDAFDLYTNRLKVLPGDYDTELNKIEPPAHLVKPLVTDEFEEIDEDRRMREQSGLVRTGRPFGGLIQDIKRKKPFYISDFVGGCHSQCLSSFLFLYFACLAPIVAFGGLLGDATQNRIATIESLMSGLISGVLFGLFAGQPLIILGSTGPVYVFEKILYQICLEQKWDYLSLRLWIGFWVAAILIFLVALDASAAVCYITRFTEELFATLIAFIFIFNAFMNMGQISQDYKFTPNTTDLSCTCLQPENWTLTSENLTTYVNWDSGATREQCLELDLELIGEDCDFQPNVFLMSVVLFSGTFAISITLKNFRNTGFLPGKIRDFLSDFAVVIAIFSMTMVSYLSDVDTPKLVVPSSFKPTWEGRDWVIAHALTFPDHILANPWWVDVFLAPIFAILATILIFMDQQITAVIVNRKEHKLIKGGGYHLDLLVLAVIIIICSLFGLPWFVAATVLSINHIQSLTKESECSAPGEKPQFLGIREQRVTAVLIAISLGLSTLITPVLRVIPMPVLFGVFLYMGVQSLKGLQFFDRLKLLLIPSKHHPDHVFLKFVPIHRVHLFTFFQLFSLIGLWLIKNNPTTSISFPIMLVVICAIRKFMEVIFTRRELRVLDDLLPESGKIRRHGGDFFDRIQPKSDSEDEEDGVGDVRGYGGGGLASPNGARSGATSPNGRKRDTRAEEEADMLRNRALAYELDDLGRTDMKTKRNQLSRVARNRHRSSLPHSHSSSAVALGPKFLIFVKLSQHEVYTPLNLPQKTVGGLLKKLDAKFQGEIQPSQVANVYQRNRRGMVFHLDDDTMEVMEQNSVFNIETKPSHAREDKLDVTLVEVVSTAATGDNSQ